MGAAGSPKALASEAVTDETRVVEYRILLKLTPTSGADRQAVTTCVCVVRVSWKMNMHALFMRTCCKKEALCSSFGVIVIIVLYEVWEETHW